MKSFGIRGLVVSGFVVLLMVGCNRPSRVEQYRAEKHRMDSVRLEEQVRSMAFYTAQLDSLMPVADSLIALFHYERNEKYQDRGYYVITVTGYGLRVLVRDDGKEILCYRNGKRVAYPDNVLRTATGSPIEQSSSPVKGRDKEALDRAEHLQIAIRDVKELERRINKTSLEISKYQRRLERYEREQIRE